MFQAAAISFSSSRLACFDLGRLIPEILAIDLGGLDGQLLGGQVGREHLLSARRLALQASGLARECLSTRDDGVDLRNILLADRLLDLQMHAVERLQQDDIEPVVASRALQILAALGDQHLELTGDGLDVVEQDAEVDHIVADDGREQQLDLIVAQVETH